jgi:hypothetical protein
MTLEELHARWKTNQDILIPPHELLPEIPRVELAEPQAKRTVHGADLSLDRSEDWVRLVAPDGCLIALAERVAEKLYHPAIVLVADPNAARARIPPASIGSTLLKTMLVLCASAY